MTVCEFCGEEVREQVVDMSDDEYGDILDEVRYWVHASDGKVVCALGVDDAGKIVAAQYAKPKEMT